MIRPSQALRLIHINRVLLRHGLDEVVFATRWLRPLRFLLYLSPWFWFRGKQPPYPVRIRQALEDLGPIFIKFGQLISTRRDLLPDDLAIELAKLQDRVPPFSGTEAHALIEQAWQRPLEAELDAFDPTPLASASIAQVHSAHLKDGRAVVVKVLRPRIEKTIRRDIGLLHILAQLIQRYWKDGRRLRPVDLVAEYKKTIFDELDLQREAANASVLRRNFLDSEAIYIPEVHWDLTRPNVMVMERIYGTPVGEVAALKTQGISMRMLGERGVEIFFTQLFRDNFFHADMHPGNIFVAPDGRYIAVDFGIVGSLTVEDQRYLAENLLAFFHRDYRRVAELHVASGWVPPETRIVDFEAAIRTVSEPIFEKPLAEISFGNFLIRLFQTARRFNMEVQPQLALLQKTLLNIEGLGRQLYPELDLWTTAKPFMEEWMKDQVGPRAFLARTCKNLGPISEQIPELPSLAYRVLDTLDRHQMTIHWRSEELERLRTEARNHRTAMVRAVSGGLLILSGTGLLLFGPGILTVFLAKLLAIGLYGTGGLLLIMRGS